MKIGVRKAWLLSCVCVCAAPALLDCGGKGSSEPDSVACAGSSASGGAAGAGGRTTIGGGRTMAGSASVGEAGSAGGSAKGCAAPTADGFDTKWMPPKATPGACNADQLAQEYALCSTDSPKYNRTACRDFEVTSANSGCLDCLFSTIEADVSGAILILPGGYWLANSGGCDALIDGDSSATSCGAREQASHICQDEVCINACSSNASDEEWRTCRTDAVSACDRYSIKTLCSNLPRYAACHLSSFAEYFSKMGDLFCGAGPMAPSPEGGAGGADGTDSASGAAGVGGAPI